MAITIKSRTFALAIRKYTVCTQKDDALVAQLVEHLTLNQRVQGSNPCWRTKGTLSVPFVYFLDALKPSRFVYLRFIKRL